MKGEEILERIYGQPSIPNGHANGQARNGAAGPTQRTGKLPKDFLVYYDQMKKAFWAKNTVGEWMMWGEAQMARRLRLLGVRKTHFEDRDAHQVEELLDNIMLDQSVHFAGELAGYMSGTYHIQGHRVLITRGPAIPKPERIEFPAINALLNSLLGEERKYFDAWIKSALLALKAGSPFRPGQVLCLAGPPGCGKSLLQDLVTEMLGGRSAKPYRYLTGDTSFNSDLFRAEHLCIEDEPASVDARTRRHFAASIKGLCVNRVQSFHPKGKDSLPLTPFWRVSISVNDDQDHLMVLPQLDDSLMDKIILLGCQQATFPFQPDDLDGRKSFRQQLSAQLPGYLYWLRAWRMPVALLDQRFGCVAYQNAALKQKLQDLEPEYKLWTLIQALDVVPGGYSGWTGTAAKLENMLIKADKSSTIPRLLYYNTACGVYLERLSRLHPENIKKLSSRAGACKWHIVLPIDDDF